MMKGAPGLFEQPGAPFLLYYIINI